MPAQVCPFREVLPQQTVCVLVGPALPRAARFAKVDPSAHVAAKLRVLCHFGSLIPGEGSAESGWQVR